MGIDFFAIFATPRRRSKKLERPADEEECEKWRPPMDPVRRRQHHHHLAEESLLFFLFFFTEFYRVSRTGVRVVLPNGRRAGLVHFALFFCKDALVSFGANFCGPPVGPWPLFLPLAAGPTTF